MSTRRPAPVTGARPAATTGERLRLAAALLLLVLAGVYGEATKVLVADDDNLWLAYAVDKSLSRSSGNALEDAVIEAVRTMPADAATPAKSPGAGSAGEALYRLEMRRDYDINYRLPLVAWAGVDRLLLSRVTDHIARTVQRLTYALLPVVLAPWLVFVWLAARSDSERVRHATLAVVAWFALVAIVNSAKGTFTPFAKPLSPQTLVDLVTFAISPGAAFSILGFTPRNMLTVLVAAALLARWSGRDRIGYALLALTAGVHTSLGLMVIACVAASDLLFGRERLRDPVVLGFLAAALIYIGINERMFSIVAPRMGLVLAVAALAGLPLVGWWIFAREPAERVALLRPLTDLALRMGRRQDPLIAQDVAVLGGALATFLVVSAVMSQIAGRHAVFYFWGQLPTRFYAAVGPGFLIGALALAFRRVPRDPLTAAVGTLAVAVIAAGVLFVGKQPPPNRKLEAELTAHEAALAGGRRRDPLGDERLIYYELGRTLANGGDVLARLRPARP